MKTRNNSRFLERRIDPKLYEFRDCIGQEVVIGLRGKDQFGNDRVGYVTGIIGLEQDSELEVGLYEIIDGETGKGLANKIMPLNLDTPIAEAFFPRKITEQVDANREGKTDLTYKVRVDQGNPNSSQVNTYRFKSK